MATEAFGEHASATDTIAAILGTYPFSVGLFRELLQNSDDAGASKQVFVLDCRQHSRQALFDSQLANTQGPALLAYNNALFTESDWEALQSIHRSSKKNDTTKIGKYGIGFRSCYHVTDNPQILSGSFLAILDPHHAFSPSGGARISVSDPRCSAHLQGFDFFYPPPQSSSSTDFKGSAIRLPLRLPNAESSLSSKSVSAEEIRTLLHDFIREELDIALLFLKNLNRIEIHEINAEGTKKLIASAGIEKGELQTIPSASGDERYSTSISTIRSSSSSGGAQAQGQTRQWRILHSSFSQDSSVEVLSNRLKRNVRPVMEKHKLYPQIGMAIPLDFSSSSSPSLSQPPTSPRSPSSSRGPPSSPSTNVTDTGGLQGRLFTHLPLPIQTGFRMCHVHGLFALTQSRQNLANKTEVGIVKGSDDSVLIEWNQVLFDTYLPRTWVTLINYVLSSPSPSSTPPSLHRNNDYGLWPPHQPVAHTGDSVYWQCLPRKVIERFMLEKSPVWPLLRSSPSSPFSSSSEVERTSLDQTIGVLVAPPKNENIDVVTLMAVVRAGVKIVRPPEYVYEILKSGFEDGVWFKGMAPDNVGNSLRGLVSQLDSLRPGEKESIFRYLLTPSPSSSSSPPSLLDNILQLPIIPTYSSSSFVTLTPRISLDSEIHTVLSAAQVPIFGAFDPEKVIPESKLKPDVIKDMFFTKENLEEFNIEKLTPGRVKSLLVGRSVKANPFGLDLVHNLGEAGTGLSGDSVKWFSQFWHWLSTSPNDKFQLEVLDLVSDLYLLPSRQNTLLQVGTGIFSDLDPGLEVGIQPVLQNMGVPFLHQKFEQPSVAAVHSNLWMRARKVIRFVNTDVHEVLDCISLTSIGFLGEKEEKVLLTYLTHRLAPACLERKLSEEQSKKIRGLPIFPLLLPNNPDSSATGAGTPVAETSSPRKSRLGLRNLLGAVATAAIGGGNKGNVSKTTGPIPECKAIYNVLKLSNALQHLPIVQEVVYLNGEVMDSSLLPLIVSDNVAAQSASEADVLALAVQHFKTQPRGLQSAFLDYMIMKRDTLPPRLLKDLRSTPFVPVADGSVQAPEHLVDPKSPLTALYLGRLDRMPRMEDESFVKQLKSLGFLSDSLTNEVILERISFISSNKDAQVQWADTVAFRLLELIYSTGYDCSKIEFPLDAKWIPTTKGYFSHEECLDGGLHRPELFDLVTPLVAQDISISPALRKVFKWDQPLPLSTLLMQLDLSISPSSPLDYLGAYRRCRALIKEFAARLMQLSDEDVLRIKSLTNGKRWIPVAGKRMAETTRAVFELPIAIPGFYEIPYMLSEREDVVDFLKRMGCTTRVTADLIIEEMGKIQGGNVADVERSILLLRSLPLDLTDKERALLMVPDMEGKFCPIPEVYFNDIPGNPAMYEVEVPVAHPLLDEQTARHLRMKRLGLKSVPLNKGTDMGVKLTTSIRNVLKQYTEQQTLTEFLANAVDAGADQFKILMDDYTNYPTAKMLTASMSMFQATPALMVFNNATFTDQDWEGICRTGVGGKENRTNTIGQFGLGALSMFHFTEMATILSGDKVLFLDPSKTHLPFEDWASLLVPLSQIQRLYQDHLVPFDGLFGYSMTNTTFYEGTIFRLPLRTAAHVSDRAILKTTRTSRYLVDNVIRTYWTQAQQSLLFTPFKTVSTAYRSSAGEFIQGWSLSAEREKSEDPTYDTRTVKITGQVSSVADPFTETWEVVFAKASINILPGEFKSLVDPHRLRSINVGFAARTTEGRNRYHAHNLFSTMPLPMLTTLPVHMTSSFILTPDRRHIRFDDYDNAESRYNRWLLSEVAPPPYLYLLERLLKMHGKNEYFWPGNTGQQDSVTRILVEAFYQKHLGKSNRIICGSFFKKDYHLPPSQAVLLGQETLPIAKIISMLPHPRFIRLPPMIATMAQESMQSVTPGLMRDAIRDNGAFIISLFHDNHLSISDIQQVLDYFLESSDLDLADMALLPLANGQLVRLRRPGGANMPRYIWNPRQETAPLFDLHHLVHPRFHADELRNQDLNILHVEHLTSDQMRSLVGKHLPYVGILEDISPGYKKWIELFWVHFPQLNTKVSDLIRFPFVPTKQFGRYISIDKATNDRNVMITTSHEKDFMDACLEKLGFIVVQRDDSDIPSALTESLRNLPAFTFTRFLDQVKAKAIKADFFLNQIDKQGQQQFAQWAKQQLSSIPTSLHPVAKRLPIWEVTLPGGETRMTNAMDVEMLPYNVPSDAAMKFCKGNIVPFHQELKSHLNVEPMTMAQLWKKVKIPTTMEFAEDLAAYKRLLGGIISDRNFSPETLLVPNGYSRMVPCSELYARESLFLSSFGDDSLSKFVITSWIDMEQRLIPFGLKGLSNLDFETFQACAAAMDSAEGTEHNRSQRAAVLFRAYAEELPLRVNVSDDSKWAQIGQYRFIPRDPMRHHNMRFTETCEYVKQLPDPVSPNEILLAELESVCWTQRAIFAVAPHSRVLVAHPTLGRPKPEEVVEHLRVLVLQVAKDHPGNQYLLCDLEATYKWLDEHQDEVEDHIIQYSSEPLFLNVDDPKTETWTWHCADEMFFNTSSNGHEVLKFLKPFKDLLAVAGVDEIVHPSVPITGVYNAGDTIQAKLAKLYSGFDMMRKQGRFTDVVFISEDEERFPAHRTVLGPMSEYLLDLFCGDFAESKPASENEPIEIEIEYSSRCLGAVLDYLYSGALTAKLDELELEDLLDGLYLSQYWGLKDFNELVQANIIQRRLITPQTYEDISERAEELNASYLIDACKFYKEQNLETIMRLRGEGGPRKPKRLPKKDAASRPGALPLQVAFPGTEKDKDGKGKRTSVRRFMHKMSMSFSKGSRQNMASGSGT